MIYLIIVTSIDIKIIKDIRVKTDKNPWYFRDLVTAPYNERNVSKKGIIVNGEIIALKNRK